MSLEVLVKQLRSSVQLLPARGFRLENNESWEVVELGGSLQVQTTQPIVLQTALEQPQLVPTNTLFAVAVRKESFPSLRQCVEELLGQIPVPLRKKMQRNWLMRKLGAPGLSFTELAEVLESITAAIAVAAVGEAVGVLSIRRPDLADMVFKHSMGGSMLSCWQCYELPRKV